MIAVGSRLGSGLAGLAALVGLFGASGPANGSSPSLAGPQEIRAAIQRPLVLDPGRCEATLVVEANFSVRRRFEPVSLAPDIHCGIVPRFMLGITHSARSLSLIDSGDGLCLSGEGAGFPPHRH